MKILAIEKEKPGVKVGDYSLHLEAEAKKVWELYQSGIIREIYFIDNPKRAVIILESENESDAKDRLSELPLVKNNLIYFEIFELKPYQSFERLFK